MSTELERAQEAARAAKEKAERLAVEAAEKADEERAKARALEREKRNKAIAAARHDLAFAIVAELRAQGAPGFRAETHTKWTGENVMFIADGIQVPCAISVDRPRHSGYREPSIPKDFKLRAVVSTSDYGNKRQWPQRKDGTHNYGAIADFILVDIAKRHRRVKEQTQCDANRDITEALKNDYPVAQRHAIDVTPTSDAETSVRISVRTTRLFNEADARRFLTALTKAGLMEE